MNIKELVKESTDTAHKHGWNIVWQNSKKEFDVPAALMLCVCELAEAMEEWRDDVKDIKRVKYVPQIGPVAKPYGFPIEIADIFIRLFHLCGDLNIDLEEALRIKMKYNKTRPIKHGHPNL